jgi:hypothetical protein
MLTCMCVYMLLRTHATILMNNVERLSMLSEVNTLSNGMLPTTEEWCRLNLSSNVVTFRNHQLLRV